MTVSTSILLFPIGRTSDPAPVPRPLSSGKNVAVPSRPDAAHGTTVTFVARFSATCSLNRSINEGMGSNP